MHARLTEPKAILSAVQHAKNLISKIDQLHLQDMLQIRTRIAEIFGEDTIGPDINKEVSARKDKDGKVVENPEEFLTRIYSSSDVKAALELKRAEATKDIVNGIAQRFLCASGNRDALRERFPEAGFTDQYIDTVSPSVVRNFSIPAPSANT